MLESCVVYFEYRLWHTDESSRKDHVVDEVQPLIGGLVEVSRQVDRSDAIAVADAGPGVIEDEPAVDPDLGPALSGHAVIHAGLDPAPLPPAGLIRCGPACREVIRAVGQVVRPMKPIVSKDIQRSDRLVAGAAKAHELH